MNINIHRISQFKLYNNWSTYKRLCTASYCSCTTLFSIPNATKNTLLHRILHKQQTSNQKAVISRKCSTEDDKETRNNNKLPTLMSFNHITWPNVIKSVRNFFLATFIIRPYFDKEFSLSDFANASKTALELVSQRISMGDFKSLEDLVTPPVIIDVQRAISSMSMSQREQLQILKEDIYFSFPYQVGIMFNDVEGHEQKRFVEITMVYHIMKGLSAMRNRGEEPPLNMGMVPEYQSRISICNYRFIREFTKGVEPKWTINLLNHFKPIDVITNK